MPPIVQPGQVAVGIQLPVQAQSHYFVEPWELEAGPAELAAVAVAADRAGFFYVAVCDHVAIPRSRAAGMGTIWYDPVATLSWLAAQTTHTRLLTSVYNLLYRSALVAAKSFATLDLLSAGRVIIGVGAGHLEEEFEAVGVTFAGRGSRLDAALGQLDEALSEEWVNEVAVAPRPIQRPRPPIWIGGSAPPAVRRAARLADGWLPQGTPREQMPALLELYRTTRGDRSGDIGAITEWLYVGTPTWDVDRGCTSGSADRIAAALRRWTELGVNHLQVRFPSRSAEELCAQVSEFGRDVLPLLS